MRTSKGLRRLAAALALSAPVSAWAGGIKSVPGEATIGGIWAPTLSASLRAGGFAADAPGAAALSALASLDLAEADNARQFGLLANSLRDPESGRSLDLASFSALSPELKQKALQGAAAAAVTTANERIERQLLRLDPETLPPAGLQFAKLSAGTMLLEYGPYLSSGNLEKLQAAASRLDSAAWRRNRRRVEETLPQAPRPEAEAVKGRSGTGRAPLAKPAGAAPALMPAADRLELDAVAEDRQLLGKVVDRYGVALRLAAEHRSPVDFWRLADESFRTLKAAIRADGLAGIARRPMDGWGKAKLTSFKGQVNGLFNFVHEFAVAFNVPDLSATMFSYPGEAGEHRMVIGDVASRAYLISAVNRAEDRAETRHAAVARTVSSLEKLDEADRGAWRRFLKAADYYRGLVEAARSNEDPRHLQAVQTKLRQKKWFDMPSPKRVIELWEGSQHALLFKLEDRPRNILLSGLVAGAWAALMSFLFGPLGLALGLALMVGFGIAARRTELAVKRFKDLKKEILKILALAEEPPRR